DEVPRLLADREAARDVAADVFRDRVQEPLGVALRAHGSPDYPAARRRYRCGRELHAAGRAHLRRVPSMDDKACISARWRMPESRLVRSSEWGTVIAGFHNRPREGEEVSRKDSGGRRARGRARATITAAAALAATAALAAPAGAAVGGSHVVAVLPATS